MTTKDGLAAALQLVADAAARARHEIRSGNTVDLASIEELVAQLKTAAQTVSRAEAEELRNAVLLLVAELDELRELIRSEHEGLRNQLQGSGTRRSAVAAYGQLPNRRR